MAPYRDGQGPTVRALSRPRGTTVLRRTPLSTERQQGINYLKHHISTYSHLRRQIPRLLQQVTATMLTDKIRLGGEATDPEDFLGESLGVIFPDDITNQHGDIDHPVTYLSPTYGSIVLQLADPQGDDNRKLFSHFLWNSGLQIAEFIEEDKEWDVKGKKVLELGAGTGLSGIIAARACAQEVIITDYPAPEVIANIKKNVAKNVPKAAEIQENGWPQCWVHGHEWGELNQEDAFVQGHKGTFDVVIVADCLWMPWQHANLSKSISWFMKPEGKAWVVAGFHTGRAKMANFFVEENLAAQNLAIESITEKDPDGIEREWVFDRGIEDVTVRKRWLVVAVLKHKGSMGSVRQDITV